MISTPERSPERDAAIEAMLPMVPISGWSMRTLIDTAGPDADLLFPGGAADMVETYVDWADRRMEAAAAAEDLSGLRVPARIRRVMALRFEQSRYDKEAVSRGLGVLSLPQNAGIGLRTAARTVDAIWHAAGDRSADFSWYTKRATLLPIYGATLLFWLRDQSADDQESLAFLDRRLAGVGRIGQMRGRVARAIERVRPKMRQEADAA
ncbi:MAG: COQ9 family protein [Acetobacteraceae bacterium]|nr:COQ9 family protein [Acetobacteraceae bacterium]